MTQLAVLPQDSLQRRCDDPGAGIQIGPGCPDGLGLKQLLDRQRQVALHGVDARDPVRLRRDQRVQVGGHELDVRGHADGAEQLARDRAEERLAELVVRQAFRQIGEVPLDVGPQRPVAYVLAQRDFEIGHCGLHAPFVQLDALDRVLVAAGPVA